MDNQKIFLLIFLCCCWSTFGLDFQLVNPKFTTNPFEYVAYGNGVYIFLYQNQTFLSEDLVTIERVTVNLTSTELIWDGICFFPTTNVFVAIGQYYTNTGQLTLLIALTSDGVTWTSPTKYSLSASPSIACGVNEIYVSTGLSVIQSANGLQWTSKTPILQLNQMVYVAEQNVYVGWTNLLPEFFVSTSGILWDVHEGPPSFPYKGLAFGNGNYVVLGSDVVYYSQNLAGWSESVVNDSSYIGLAFSTQTNLFTMSSNEPDGLQFWYSQNGDNWSKGSLFSNGPSINQIISTSTGANTNYVAVGSVSLLANSTSGADWSLFSGEDFFTDLSTIYTLENGSFVAPDANSNKLWQSNDGLVWTELPLNLSIPLSTAFKPFAASDLNLYVSYDSQHVYISPDGINWDYSLNASYWNIRSISSVILSPAYGLVVNAVEDDLDYFLTTTDGRQWSRVYTKQMPSQLSNLYYEPINKIYLGTEFDNGGFLYYSEDLVNWNNASTYFRINSNNYPLWISNENYIVFTGFPILGQTIDNLTNFSEQWISNDTLNFPVIDALVYQDMFVFLGSEQTQYAISMNGTYWFPHHIPDVDIPLTGFTLSSDGIQVVGSSGVLVTGQ